MTRYMLANTPACFEPALDYVVTKMPRFPFDKFAARQQQAVHADEGHRRGHEPWAAPSRRACSKAVRSLEIGANHLYHAASSTHMPIDELLDYIKDGTDDRIFAIAQLMWLRRGPTAAYATQHSIDMLFLDKINNIVEL